MRVLIIEDNRDLLENLVDFLESRGHVVDSARDGITGLHLAATTFPEALVLDLGLPGMDGMTVCERLRDAGCAFPILMLTARDEIDDRVNGLKTGADDYIIKPIAMRELEARLHAQVRRATGGHANHTLRVADLELDTRTREVQRNGHPIPLTRIDYEILRLLMQASPAVLDRAHLEEAIWEDEPPSTETLRTHIYRLRRAIDHPFSQPLLHTVHGIGYRLASDE